MMRCPRPRNFFSRWCALGLFLLTPMLMGGCPELRNESVTAVEVATRGLIDAALGAYFDALRTDDL